MEHLSIIGKFLKQKVNSENDKSVNSSESTFFIYRIQPSKKFDFSSEQAGELKRAVGTYTFQKIEEYHIQMLVDVNRNSFKQTLAILGLVVMSILSIVLVTLACFLLFSFFKSQIKGIRIILVFLAICFNLLVLAILLCGYVAMRKKLVTKRKLILNQFQKRAEIEVCFKSIADFWKDQKHKKKRVVVTIDKKMTSMCFNIRYAQEPEMILNTAGKEQEISNDKTDRIEKNNSRDGINHTGRGWFKDDGEVQTSNKKDTNEIQKNIDKSRWSVSMEPMAFLKKDKRILCSKSSKLLLKKLKL